MNPKNKLTYNNNLVEKQTKPKKSLTDQAIYGFAWMTFGSSSQGFIQLIVLLFLARLVTPEAFGIISTAMIIVGFTKIFREVGIASALVQRKDLEESHISTAFWFSVCLGSIFYGLIYFTSPLFSIFFEMEPLTNILKVVCLVFILQSISMVSKALLQKEMRFKTISIIEVGSYLFGYGLIGIITASLGWGTWALVAAILSQTTMRSVLLISIRRHSFSLKFEYKALCELLYFGGGMSLAKIGNYFASQGDNIAVARILGATPLGFYGRAYGLMAMPVNMFGTVIDKVLFPAMSQKQDDKNSLGEVYLNMVSLVALIAFPISVFIFIMASDIVNVVLGSNWLEVITPLKILSFGFVFRMSYKMSDTVARATGSVYRRAWRQWVFAVLVLSGSSLGAVFYGINGVSVGVVFALLCNYLIMAHLIMDVLSLKWINFFSSQSRGMLLGAATLFVCGATNFVIKLFTYSSFYRLLIVSALTGITIFLMIKFLCKTFFSDYQYRLLTRISKNLLNIDLSLIMKR